jgi:hypothetical protein
VCVCCLPACLRIFAAVFGPRHAWVWVELAPHARTEGLNWFGWIVGWWVLVCLCFCVLVCLCACVRVCLCACVLVCLCACVLVCLCACLLACLLSCLPVCLPAFACRSSACSPACRLPACAPAVLSGRGPWVPCAVRFLGSSLSAGLFSESYNRPAVCVSFLLTLHALFPNRRAAGQQFFGAEVQFTQPRFELCDRRKPLAADSRVPFGDWGRGPTLAPADLKVCVCVCVCACVRVGGASGNEQS